MGITRQQAEYKQVCIVTSHLVYLVWVYANVLTLINITAQCLTELLLEQVTVWELVCNQVNSAWPSFYG